MAKSEIVVAGSFAALAQIEGDLGLQDIVNINMGGGGVDPSMLDRVKVPSGGGLAWEVPTLDGGSDPKKELVGVIVGVQNIRSYYSTEYTGGNEPPDCASRDGIYGEPASDAAEGFGGNCAKCPMSQWGTGKNGGQACSQRKLLLLLQEDSMLPLVVNVPPSSLRELDKFLLRLTAKKLPFFKAVVSLKLVKEKSAGGIDYARIAPGFVRQLDEVEAKSAQAMYASLRSVFGHVAQEAAEGGGF